MEDNQNLYIINEMGNPARCTLQQYKELVQTRPGIRVVEETEWQEVVNRSNDQARMIYGEPASNDADQITQPQEPTDNDESEQSGADDLAGKTKAELLEVLKNLDPETTLDEKSVKADIIEAIEVFQSATEPQEPVNE